MTEPAPEPMTVCECGAVLYREDVVWMLDGQEGIICLACHNLKPERPGYIDCLAVDLGPIENF